MDDEDGLLTEELQVDSKRAFKFVVQSCLAIVYCRELDKVVVWLEKSCACLDHILFGSTPVRSEGQNE